MSKNSMKSTYGAAKDNYTKKIKIKSWVLFAWMVILTIICLLPIYILLINSTRSSVEIQNGFSLIPSGSFGENFKTLTTSSQFKSSINMAYGYKNSAIITICATILTVFFSALTSYGIHVYDFKLKKFLTQ